ncbi:hypothetical protein [Paenibacillus cremeus]|uniref:DUF4367 domain-containing protein n=1 Tax=Paenibacillus cremeus TaxID=2163881 RepID=A0A559KIA1_9BACL|nr:hypothetical protein [Paenibacillus cremeus]TVY11864.1 hypothetical protein FPZ49_00805 [Paenibacillus cremeus]
MKIIPTTKNWKRVMIWSAVLLASIAITTGCKKQTASPPQTAGTTPAPSPSPGQAAGQTPTGQQPQTPAGGQTAATPTPQPAAVKLVPITFDAAQKAGMTATAKNIKLATVYIPQSVAEEDKLDQLQSAGKQMTIKLLKMSIIESAEDMMPAGAGAQDVKLSSGTGKAVNIGGQNTIYLKQGSTFIALTSQNIAINDLAKIADTLTPLK